MSHKKDPVFLKEQRKAVNTIYLLNQNELSDLTKYLKKFNKVS